MNIKPIQISILLATFFWIACQYKEKDGPGVNRSETELMLDTIVGTKIITDEIGGGAYRKRAKGYFLISNKDTSVFTCIFTESNEGAVGLDMHLPYKKTLTYRERMLELERLLPTAATDFNFDSLKTVSLGRLVLSGDLAVDVTEQFMESGYDEQLPDYEAAAFLLKESRLRDDFNRLFAPYSIEVDRVSIEKLFYTTKKELLNLSVLDLDTAGIPWKIVDCITWVRLKKTN